MCSVDIQSQDDIHQHGWWPLAKTEKKGSQADEHMGWEEIWYKAIWKVFGKLGISQAYVDSKEEGLPFPHYLQNPRSSLPENLGTRTTT